MFTNEDFADYVVGISLMFQKNEVCISKEELIDCLNYYYLKYCEHRHLIPQPLVPIRTIERYALFFE